VRNLAKSECNECSYLNNRTENPNDYFDEQLLIFESKNFLAYYTKKPVVKDQITVLPKKHHNRVIEFSPSEWKDFGELLQNITAAGSMRSYNLLIPSGIDFGKHLVIHLLPAGKEGYSFPWEEQEELAEEELKRLILHKNEVNQKMPIKGRSIILEPTKPRKEDIAFEDIIPGMPCLIHGTRHNCEFSPPKDAIPPIYNPKFISVSEAKYLYDEDLVTSVVINGTTKAYPIKILDYHEIVSDVIDGKAIAVSYCPLCTSSLVFSRHIDPEKPPTQFGVSGFLYQSDLMMYDHATESLWSQIEGECVYGELLGKQLELIPFQLMKWKNWKKKYPNGLVLSDDTGFARNYSHFPYGEYGLIDRVFFPTKKKDEKNRLHPKTIIYALQADGIAKVYPEDFILNQKIINDKVGQVPIVIAVDDQEGIFAFEAKIDKLTLTFKRTEEGLVDNETQTVWSFTGRALTGKLAGSQLVRRPDFLRMYYFAWVAFNPAIEVEIYQNIHEKAKWKEFLFRKFKKKTQESHT